MDADGASLQQLTFGEGAELDSAVSPDGNWIAYDSRVFQGSYGKSALWKMSSDGGDPVRLSDIDCITPHFSPDGKFISCVSENGRTISIVSTDDGTTVNTFKPVEDSLLTVGSPWTPDGSALAYIVQRKNVGNVWLQPIKGDAARPLTDFTSGDIYNSAFSVDGSKIYLARGYPVRNAVLIRNVR